MPRRKTASAAWTSRAQATEDRQRRHELSSQISGITRTAECALTELLHDLEQAQAQARQYRAQAEQWRKSFEQLKKQQAAG